MEQRQRTAALAPSNYQHQLWCTRSNYSVTGSLQRAHIVQETKQSIADMRNDHPVGLCVCVCVAVYGFVRFLSMWVNKDMTKCPHPSLSRGVLPSVDLQGHSKHPYRNYSCGCLLGCVLRSDHHGFPSRGCSLTQGEQDAAGGGVT